MVSMIDVDYEASVGHGVGGHMPVFLNDVLNHRYIVRGKLGVGKYSVVWRCYDQSSMVDVAIKVGRCGPSYNEASEYEASVMRFIADPSSDGSRSGLLDMFNVDGTFGRHVCIVMELRGPSLAWVLELCQIHDQMLPLHVVTPWIAQLAADLESLHAMGYIHSDIKADNILLDRPLDGTFIAITDARQVGARPESDVLLSMAMADRHGLSGSARKKNAKRIARLLKTQRRRDTSKLFIQADRFVMSDFVKDLGERRAVLADLSNVIREADVREHDSEFQSREYRSPEVLLGLPFTTDADIWSLGCLIFEMVTTDTLFQPKSSATWTKDDDHVAQIVELMGPPSAAMIEAHLDNASAGHLRAIFKETFARPLGSDASSPLRRIKNLKPWPLKDVLMNKYHMSDFDSSIVVDLMSYALRWSTRDRSLEGLRIVAQAYAEGLN